MDQKCVFINCISEDREFADRLKHQLVKSGIQVVMPGENISLRNQKEVVEQLESVAEQEGVMVLLLSANSAQDSLLISNTQYFCELAGKRQALVICKLGDVPRENAIAFYYPRGLMVNTSSKKESVLEKIEINVKRMLGMPVPATLIPKRLSRKAILRIALIFGALALLGGLGAYFLDRYQEKQAILEAAQQAAQAPVIISEPFSSQSVDQGLQVLERMVDKYQPDGNPANQAPFFFTPTYTHTRLEFNDPAYDGSINHREVVPPPIEINQSTQQIIRQENGVVHFAVFTEDRAVWGNEFSVKHLITMQETSYIGIRFRLEDYNGWNNNDAPNYAFAHIEELQLFGIDLGSQLLFSPVPELAPILLETGWHSIEVIFDIDRNTAEIYLDGQKYCELSEIPAPEKILHLVTGIDVGFSTEWVHFYIDEIIIGGNEPLKHAVEPEQATYHFEPEESFYTDSFDDASILQFMEGEPNVTIAESKLVIDFPGNLQSHTPVNFRIPTQPITEANYVALKYRITESSNYFWTYNGQIFLSISNLTFENPNEGLVWVSKNTNNGELSAYDGQDIWGRIYTSEEQGWLRDWHTLEMVLLPSSAEDGSFILQAWQDGILLMENQVVHPEHFLDPSVPLVVMFNFNGAESMRDAAQIEVDEVVIGLIDAEPEGE